MKGMNCYMSRVSEQIAGALKYAILNGAEVEVTTTHAWVDDVLFMRDTTNRKFTVMVQIESEELAQLIKEKA